MALDGVLKIWPWPSGAGRKTGSDRATAKAGRKARSAAKGKSRLGLWPALRSAGFALVGLAALVAVSLGLVVSYQALLISPFFALERLSLSGQERLQREEILKLAGIGPGVNLLKLDPRALVLRLESSPWVEKAQVRRVLPDELRIHIQEKKPWVLLHADGLWYLDRIGQPIKRIEPGEMFNLPIITGLTQKALESPQGRRDLAEAMDVVAKLSRGDAPLALDQVSEIRFSLGSGVTILPLAESPRVILGRGGIALKMEHWRKVLADLEAKGIGPRVEYIDLRLGDKAFVGLKTG